MRYDSNREQRAGKLWLDVSDILQLIKEGGLEDCGSYPQDPGACPAGDDEAPGADDGELADDGHGCEVPLCDENSCGEELEHPFCDGEEGSGICPTHGERFWYHDDDELADDGHKGGMRLGSRRTWRRYTT